MKKFVSVVAILTLVWGCLGFLAQPAQALDLSSFTWQSPTVLVVTERRNPADTVLDSDYGQKLDLNNANVRLFRKYRGFFPTLAKKIVANAPYEKVEDVLEIPGLSEKQKERLQANLDNFTVTPTADVFNVGDDRINPGQY